MDNSTKISIHALREEGDDAGTILAGALLGISIHALREEGDYYNHSKGVRPEGFLSTPSARRATAFFFQPVLDAVISIHALREEGDTMTLM